MADLPLAEVASVTIETADGGTKLQISAGGAALIDGSAVTQPTTAVDATGTGSITASGQTIVANCAGASSVSWQLSGLFVATYTFEASLDGTNWVLNGYQGEADGIGMVLIPCGGFKQMRLRCTAYTSGTLNVIWYTSLGVNTVFPVQVSGTSLVVSATSLPLPTGAATSALQTTGNASLVSIDAALPAGLGQTTMANSLAIAIASDQTTIPVSIATLPAANPTPASLGVTGTAATGVAVTVTLPAVASQFHYITKIEVQLYTTGVRTGGATPILVTTTNLPGSPVWDFATAGALGTTDKQTEDFNLPIKSVTVNTASTIVCPATTGGIWRVNVFYYAAV